MLHPGGKDGWVSGKQIVFQCNNDFTLTKVVTGFLSLRRVLQLITTKK